jgi:hypothetical protein
MAPNSKKTVDKVATAKEVERIGCQLDVLDLKGRITELVAFIRKANSLSTASSVIAQTSGYVRPGCGISIFLRRFAESCAR